jgi:CopG antitoxin of type II toxin-antitoxin system
MSTRSTTKQEAADALLAKSHADDIPNADIVRAAANPAPPISLRLSAPLLERLKQLAEAQHRKRSNLIQHILWEYVRTHRE